MRYYVIAGEASGDLHGANLIHALKLLDPAAELRGWGGDLMEKAGVTVVKHYRDLAFMGFVEVIANIKTIYNNLKFCKQDISEFKPDVLILIDYPGFNLRIAEFASAQKIKVVYYISPQIWAWKQNRVFKIRDTVDRMLVILPFEKEFYQKFGMDVNFVGHPLLDAMQPAAVKHDAWLSTHKLSGKPIVALLPGSRRQEIRSMLPLMIQAASQFSNLQAVIAGAPGIPEEFYSEISGGSTVHVVQNDTYNLLQHSSLALVTSGTATLETALFNVPEVVCYKGNKMSYYIARKLIKVKYISLVNLVMDREVVKELIQDELNVSNLVAEMNKLLQEDYRRNLLNDYQELRIKLGSSGASAKAAQSVFELAVTVV